MRHQKAGRKLGRVSSHRKAMLRNMLASIFAHEKVETTTPKAKELKPLAEKMITLGKRGDLHSRRRVLRLIPDRKIVHKLFEEIAPRYQERAGGCTRITRTGYRPGDNAPLSVIELIQDGVQAKKKKAKKKTGAKAAPETKKEQAAAPASESQPEKAEKAAAGEQANTSAPEVEASAEKPVGEDKQSQP